MNHGDIDRFVLAVSGMRASVLGLEAVQLDLIGALLRFQEAWGDEIPLELE